MLLEKPQSKNIAQHQNQSHFRGRLKTESGSPTPQRSAKVSFVGALGSSTAPDTETVSFRGSSSLNLEHTNSTPPLLQSEELGTWDAHPAFSASSVLFPSLLPLEQDSGAARDQVSAQGDADRCGADPLSPDP